MRSLAGILAVLLAAVSTAGAVAVNIVNPGFESDAGLVNAGTTWSDNTPTGWLDPDNPGTNPNSNFMENIGGFASDGIVHLGFDGTENGIIYQDLSTAWAPNTKYTLTIGVGNRSGFGAGVGLFGLTSTNDGVVASNDAFSLAPFSSTVDTSTFAVVADAFADMTLTYTTGAVAPSGDIRLFVKDVSATRIHVDNFRLDAAPVPEPTVMVGLALGCGLLLRRRRR